MSKIRGKWTQQGDKKLSVLDRLLKHNICDIVLLIKLCEIKVDLL